MKIRTKLISNSSSASFVIDKRYLTESQVDAISNYAEYAEKHFPEIFYIDNFWEIKYSGKESDIIILSTIMDNFNMRKFLDLIHVPPEAIIKKGW